MVEDARQREIEGQMLVRRRLLRLPWILHNDTQRPAPLSFQTFFNSSLSTIHHTAISPSLISLIAHHASELYFCIPGMLTLMIVSNQM